MTIGSFDGVHLGHRKLLQTVREKARQRSAKSLVLTFSPHPLEILHPETKFLRLFDVQDQVAQMERQGIDYFVVEPFTKEFARMPASRFLHDYLFPRFSPVGMAVGYDFKFGAGQLGTLEFLRAEGAKRGMDIEVVPALKIDGQVVSSSLIRGLITAGKVEDVEMFLGRNYYVKGKVEKGDRRGSSIGFPTANISVTSDVTPRLGVYATLAEVRGRSYTAVSNLGVRPTFHGGTNPPVFLETHIFDFQDSIYGEELRIVFKKFLREEKKFGGAEELVRQIRSDVAAARGYFS